jgi:hypothetical protein
VLRLVADEDLHGAIIRGVIRRLPLLDLVRAEDVGLLQTHDPVILDWADSEGRLVVTHDVNTMTRHALDRVRAGARMPGLIVVPQTLPIGTAIEEIVTLIECSSDDEWEGQIVYLPL